MKYGTIARISAEGNLADNCEAKFSLLEQMGLESCQLIYSPATYELDDADIIRESASRHHIEISAQFCGFNDPFVTWGVKYGFCNDGINVPAYQAIRLKYLISAIPFLQRLGITDMITHAGFVSNNPFDDSFVNMCAAVSILGTKLKAAGLNLLFETGTESPITLLRVIDAVGTGNLFVNLDTGNLILYGFGNPVDAVYTFGQYVRNIHAKDALPPTVPGSLGTEVTIGTGFVDFPRVFQMLRERGYDRYITVEREIAAGDQNAEIAKAVGYLKSCWENANRAAGGR